MESIHREMRRLKVGRCQACGATGKRTEVAFLRHPEPYTRDPADYTEMCCACHQAFDWDEREEARRRFDSMTHCKRGHEMNFANTYIRTRGNGRRQCRPCHALEMRERRAAGKS